MKKYTIVFNDGTVVGEVSANNKQEAMRKIAKEFSEGIGGPDYWKGMPPSEIEKEMAWDYEAVEGNPEAEMMSYCGPGEEWVPPYHKKDGTYVHGFCRRKR